MELKKYASTLEENGISTNFYEYQPSESPVEKVSEVAEIIESVCKQGNQLNEYNVYHYTDHVDFNPNDKNFEDYKELFDCLSLEKIENIESIEFEGKDCYGRIKPNVGVFVFGSENDFKLSSKTK